MRSRHEKHDAQDSGYHDGRTGYRNVTDNYCVEGGDIRFHLSVERRGTDGGRTIHGQCGRRSDSVSGAIAGLTNQTISGVPANPSFPSASYSPDGSFIYNNLYYPTGATSFDVNGLLFITNQNPGGYWNLWGTSPGNYSLYESAGSYNYPIEEFGSLSVAAAPEPSTWAMLALGFAALSLVGRRHQRTARLAPSLG